MIYLALLSPLVLWVFFLAYSALKLNWDYLRPEVKAVGGLVVLAGLIVDVGLNWTVGLVLGVTRDFTLSQKCRWLGQGSGWRARVAKYLCKNWLNPFDIGHC